MPSSRPELAPIVEVHALTADVFRPYGQKRTRADSARNKAVWQPTARVSALAWPSAVRARGRARPVGAARRATAHQASGRCLMPVLGNAWTSRMLSWLVSSAIHRSMPSAMPPCGGAPYSNASSTAPNLACSRLGAMALERERARQQVVAVNSDRSATQLPAVEHQVVLERTCSAGGIVGRRLRAGRPTSSSAALHPPGSTPLNGLCVASQRLPSASHLYIGKL